jgi:flagellar P-ring protein precursor FlgI
MLSICWKLAHIWQSMVPQVACWLIGILSLVLPPHCQYGGPVSGSVAKVNGKKSIFRSLAARLALFVFIICATTALLMIIYAPVANAASRIKDLVDIEGIRENQLVGYGLVVGLNGTGDKLGNSPFTRQSLQSMLERLGVNTRDKNLRTKNVAAVMVTANLPPFATQGTRIDITVSALGDAKSLQGGTLLVTPMRGANGEVFAVGQGSVAIAGFKAEGEAASITRGVPTVGRIANGAIIEREIKHVLGRQNSLRLALRNPDLTTARRIASAINAFRGRNLARAIDPSTVRIELGAGKYHPDIVSLLTEIEQLRVEPDQKARVIIDERTGIIVMGRDVKVSTVAVAQGNLTVTISERPQISQPEPFSDGQTTIAPRSRVNVDDSGDRKLAIIGSAISLRQLVDGLNALGLGPRDMISILQAIKAAGALQAEIEVL